jgi:hypothetical protein
MPRARSEGKAIGWEGRGSTKTQVRGTRFPASGPGDQVGGLGSVTALKVGSLRLQGEIDRRHTSLRWTDARPTVRLTT